MIIEPDPPLPSIEDVSRDIGILLASFEDIKCDVFTFRQLTEYKRIFERIKYCADELLKENSEVKEE